MVFFLAKSVYRKVGALFSPFRKNLPLKGAPLEGLQTLESINPNPGGVGLTWNDVKNERIAQAWNDNGALVLGTSDPRAFAGVQGDILTIPSEVLQTPLDPESASANLPLQLAFNLGDVQPGQFASYTSVFALGATLDAASAAYDAAQPDLLIWGRDDVFAVEVAPGQKLVFKTYTPFHENGDFYRNGLDPTLRLYGPDGSLVAENDDCADSASNHCSTTSSEHEAVIEYQTPADAAGAQLYKVRVSNSSKASLFTNSETQSITRRAGGDYMVLIRISTPPSIDDIPDQTIQVGRTLDYRITATDPDPTTEDRLKFSLGTKAPPGATIDSDSGFFSWTPQKAGTYPVEVVVEDRSWAQDRKTFTVDVTPLLLINLPVIMGN